MDESSRGVLSRFSYGATEQFNQPTVVGLTERIVEPSAYSARLF